MRRPPWAVSAAMCSALACAGRPAAIDARNTDASVDDAGSSDAGSSDGGNDAGPHGWLIETQGEGSRIVAASSGTALLTFPDQFVPDAGIAAIALDDDGKTRWSRALPVDAPSVVFTCATRAGDRSWFGIVSTAAATYDLGAVGSFAVAEGDALFVAIDDAGNVAAATTVVGAIGCALAGFADGSFASFTYAAPANTFNGSVVRRHDGSGTVTATTALALTPSGIRAAAIAARDDGRLVVVSAFRRPFALAFIDGSTATVPASASHDEAVALGVDANGGITWGVFSSGTDLDGAALVPDVFVSAASLAEGFLVCGASNDARLSDAKTGAVLADNSGITHTTPVAFALDVNGALASTHRFDDVTGLVSDCEADATDTHRAYAAISREDGTGFQIAQIDDDVVTVGARVFDGTSGETMGIVHRGDSLTFSAVVPALSTTTIVNPSATAPGLAGAFVNIVMQAPLDVFLP
jgi:hypothetical protein